VLGPGEVRLAQDLAGHRVGGLRVGCGQAAEGSGPIVFAPRSPRSTSACRLSAARAGVGEQVAQPAVFVVEVQPVGVVVDDPERVGVGEFGRKLEGGTSTLTTLPVPKISSAQVEQLFAMGVCRMTWILSRGPLSAA